MQYALYGALGAILALFLFGGGIYLGLRIKARGITRRADTPVRALTEEEKQKRHQMIADHQAFVDLCNYSSELAYNIEPDEAPKEADV